MMTKKLYTVPSVECISLEQTVSLMAGSDIDPLAGLDLDDAQGGTGIDADARLLDDIELMIMQ